MAEDREHAPGPYHRDIRGNSSGKTSILQLLLMLKQTAESPDRAQALIFGDERSPANLGTFRDVLYHRSANDSHKDRGAAEASVAATPDNDAGSRLAFGISWTTSKELEFVDPEDSDQTLLSGKDVTFKAEIDEYKGRPSVRLMEYGFAGHSFTMEPANGKRGGYKIEDRGPGFSLKRRQGRPSRLPGPVKCYGFPDQVKADYQNGGFLSDLQLAFEELFAQVYYLGPLREYPKRQYTWAGTEPADMGQRGERAVDALLAARQQGMKISPGWKKRKKPLEQYVAERLKEIGLLSRDALVG